MVVRDGIGQESKVNQGAGAFLPEDYQHPM
jgi:hypothetical protein